METEQYIKCFRTKSRESHIVAMRQALCYYLYKEDIPCTIISKVMGNARWNIYLSIYKMRDLLEVGDKMAKRAYDEISLHSIRIVPATVDGKIMTRKIGYKLIIDNIIV